MKSVLFRVLAVLMVSTLISCGDDEQTTRPVVPADSTDFGAPPSWMDTIVVDTTMISREPLPDGEAEWVALYLSRHLMAPLDVYERIHRDLGAIRATYAYLDPPLKGAFREYWSPGVLRVTLREEAVDRYLAGTYTDLDELNRLFRLSWINDRFVERYGVLSLVFKSRLHPGRLAGFYGSVLSLERVSIWETGCCDGDLIYPWYTNGKLTYLFKDGENDCPSGCIDNRYWYFRTDHNGNIEYLGTFADWTEEPKPAWWSEANRNIRVWWSGEWW